MQLTRFLARALTPPIYISGQALSRRLRSHWHCSQFLARLRMELQSGKKGEGIDKMKTFLSEWNAFPYWSRDILLGLSLKFSIIKNSSTSPINLPDKIRKLGAPLVYNGLLLFRTLLMSCWIESCRINHRISSLSFKKNKSFLWFLFWPNTEARCLMKHFFRFFLLLLRLPDVKAKTKSLFKQLYVNVGHFEAK